ncbi:MAG: pentapeptide repeat-containing protein [Rivularia sp. (in: cyanobacteria)]
MGSISLNGADFSNANLRGVNFDYVYLRQTNFSNANLENASFIYANLYQANFSNANLENAKFHDAALKKSDFSNANLTNAKLLHANLYKTNLNNAINALTINNFYHTSEANLDLEIVSSIKESSHGLSFISEGDYPYEVFLWDIKNRGEFTVDKLIQIIGHPDYLYPSYRLGNIEEVPDKEDLKLAFAKEHEPKPEEPLFIDGIEYQIIENPPSPYSKQEPDYSDEYVVECEIYHKYRLFDHFFGFVYGDGGIWENQTTILEGFLKFARIVTDNLSNITVFRLGETQVHVYLVGQTKNGNWIVIHTISIET